MTKTKATFHVLSERINHNHVWVKQTDGLFDTVDGTLKGYAFTDKELIPCVASGKKCKLAICLGTRFSRFQVSWLHRSGGERLTRVTHMVSVEELEDVIAANFSNLRIEGLS